MNGGYVVDPETLVCLLECSLTVYPAARFVAALDNENAGRKETAHPSSKADAPV